MIFEMKGPNMMKNQPCQPRSSLPIWWLFAFLVYFKMFLKFLSLASAFLARNPNLSFLNNCHDLMTKRLPNSSVHFKQRSFILFDHANVLSFHACHYFIQTNSSWMLKFKYISSIANTIWSFFVKNNIILLVKLSYSVLHSKYSEHSQM